MITHFVILCINPAILFVNASTSFLAQPAGCRVSLIPSIPLRVLFRNKLRLLFREPH